MSFTERVERLGKDLGGAALAPFKLVWDIGTAALNDEEEFNGIANTLKTSFGNFGKSLARPVGDLLSDIDAINRTVVREPLTNLLLNNYLRQQEDVGYFFDNPEWKKKWEEKDEVSFGQALALNLFGDTLIRRAELPANSEFDIFNDEQRDQVFKKSLFGRLTSGSFDFAVQIFGDVTLVGGKAVRVAKASEYGVNALKNSDLIIKAIDDIKLAQQGTVNKYTRAIKDFTENGVDYALARDLVKSSDDPTTLAYLLGKSTDENQTALVLRMALGDKDALFEFEKLRPSQAYAFKNSTGQMTETERAIRNPKPNPDGTLNRTYDDPNVIDEVKKEYDDLFANDEYFRKFVSLGRDIDGNYIQKPILTRTVGTTRVQGFEDFLARGRVSKFYDRPIGEAREDVYQPTKLHRAYKKITWAADERPAGHIDLNDPDSYAEFQAAVTRALAVLGRPKYDDKGKLISGMSGEEARAFIDDFTKAMGPEQRAVVVYNLEREVTKRVAARHGITVDRADDLYEQFRGKRISSLKKFKELGFGIDEAGQMLKVPILESQTVNSLPVMNFDILASAVKREQDILKSGLTFKDGIIDFADTLQDLFKAGTLLRLGYTMRNAVDSQLRIAAAFGPLYALNALPQGVKNFIENAGPRGKRMIDNLQLLKTKDTRYTKVRKLQKQLAEEGRTLSSLRKELDINAADLETFKKGPEIPRFEIKDQDNKVIYTADEVDAIKFGNEDTLKRFAEKEKNLIMNDPEMNKFAEKLWNETLPGGDQVRTIESLFPATKAGKAELGRFKRTGAFPAHILKRFFKKDKYGNRVPLKADDPLAGYDIEDIQAILFPDSDRFELFDIGEIENRITGATRGGKKEIQIDWYPSLDKKNQFIEEYKIDQVNRYATPQVLRERILMQEEQHIAKYTQKWPESDVSLNSQRQFLEDQLKTSQEKFEMINKQLDLLERSPKKKMSGEGMITLPSKFSDEGYSVPDAFGSKNADIYRQKVSNASTYENLQESNPKYIASRLENQGFGTVTPNEVYYYEEWARVLSQQFSNSDVVKYYATKYLQTGNYITARNATKKWLANSSQGRRIRARLSPKAFTEGKRIDELPGLGISRDEVSDYVNNITNLIRRYAPESPDNILLQRLSKGEIVTPSEMRSWFPNPDINPNIHGRLISENLTNNLGQTINESINKAFQALGTLPEDTWARFPLYITLYRKELQQRFATLEGLKKGALTASEQEAAMRAAHTYALRQVNKTLFTIVRRSNVGASTFIRLISPFFSAQENALKTWGRIIGNNPAILNRGQLLWTAPNRAGLVTDQEGNQIPQENLTRDGVIWLEVPKTLQKLPGLSSLNQMGISKNSLDIVFGGGFEIPVGPYVAIPASEIVKRKPELEDSLKWAIPFGPERNAINALLPSWLKRQITRAQGQNSPEYARAYQLIWTTEQHKAREEGRPYLTPTEIQKKVDAYYNMRSIANLVLPFAPRFDTPYRMYMDKWREFQRTFGKDADEQYLKEFGPEFFDFAMSLSQNVGGVQASVDATLAIRENKDLVADLYASEPALIGLIVNNPTGYDFSQAAYEWEYATPITPGSKVTFRGTADPAEVAQKNQAKLGWIQYRQFMSTEIEPVLVARGLSSLRDRRARDLRALRDEMITKLANENTAWYDDYLDTDGSKTNRVIRGLQRILSDEKFMTANADNPTWQSLMAYLALRNEVAKELSKRKTKTLGAKANIQLALAFDAAVGRLKQDDIGFSDIYDRFLSNDPVYDKYLTESQV